MEERGISGIGVNLLSVVCLAQPTTDNRQQKKSIMQAYLSIQQNQSNLFVRHNNSNSCSNNWLDEVKNVLLSEMDNPGFTIPDLANAMCMSERSFHRKIKELTGQTANVFIQRQRLTKAKELLELGRLSLIKEVAYRVGYQRVDYFSNLFERHYGIRPAELINL